MKKSKLILGALLFASIFTVTSCNFGGNNNIPSSGTELPSSTPQNSSSSTPGQSSSSDTPKSSSSAAPANTSTSAVTPSSSSTPSSTPGTSSTSTPTSTSKTTPTTSSTQTVPTTTSTTQVAPTQTSSVPTSTSTSQSVEDNNTYYYFYDYESQTGTSYKWDVTDTTYFRETKTLGDLSIVATSQAQAGYNADATSLNMKSGAKITFNVSANTTVKIETHSVGYHYFYINGYGLTEKDGQLFIKNAGEVVIESFGDSYLKSITIMPNQTEPATATITDLVVEGAPSNDIAVGDDCDLSTLKVKAIYSDKLFKYVTDYTTNAATAINKTQAGTYTVTVSYGGQTKTFTVKYVSTVSNVFDTDSVIDFTTSTGLSSAIANTKITWCDSPATKFRFDSGAGAVQLKSGATFSFDVKSSATVKVISYGGSYGYLLINGVSNDSTAETTINADSDKTITIAFDSNHSSACYIKKIEITYPAVSSYSVTFETAHGDTPTALQNKTTVALSELPTFSNTDGYKFNGWKLNGNLVTADITLTGNITLVADWELITYTVTFETAHGDTPASLEDKTTVALSELPTFSNTDGYKFNGWKLNGTLVTSEITLTDNITLVADWKLITYTVSFETAHGDTPTALTGRTSVLLSELPTYNVTDSYKFNGWKLNDTLVVADITLTDNITLVADWEYVSESNQATVSFVTNNSNVTFNDIKVVKGETITLPTLSQAGYQIEGFYTNSGMTDPFESTTVINSTCTIYVKINEIFTISFVTNCDTVLQDAVVVKGSTLSEPAALSKDATAQYTYTFDKWYKESTFQNEYDFTAPVISSFTIYANWNETINKYTYKFYDEDGTTELKNANVDYGTQIEAPTDPTKAAIAQYTYAFDGWYTSISDGTKVTSFPTITGTVSYYARYTSTTNKYTYTFYDEDGTTELKSSNVNYGTQITAPSNPTKSATSEYTYTFDGWYTAVSGGTKVTAFPTVTGTVSYYARYTQTAIDANTITQNTAYSFTGSATQSGDIVFTESGNNSAPFTSNKLTVDTSNNGKFVSNGGGWYQINKNTVLSFTVSQSVRVTITMYGNSSTSNLYTISGPGLSDTSNTETVQSFNIVGAGQVTIVENTNDYISRIEIELVDESVTAESINVVYVKTAKSTNTSHGNGTYKTVNAKTIYNVGDSFNTDGIYGVVAYSNNTSEIILGSGLTYSGFDSSSTGKKTVTVSYTAGGKTVSSTFKVYVTNASPSVVNDVVQVKVNPNYTGNPGTIVAGFNIFLTINQALDYLRSLNSSYTNKTKLLYVTTGTYNEKLWIDIPNLIIRGSNKTNTTIEYDSLYYNSNYASLNGYKDASIDPDGFEHVTDSTQTVTIAESAVNCTIYDITISNYWNSYDRFHDAFGTNSVEHRALALLIYADKVVVQDTKLLGYQDTLEIMSGRSYFYNSYISGATDFIFGTNPTVLFDTCEIRSIYNGSTDGGYINAFKGTNQSDPKTYGVIYDKCTFTKDDLVTSSNTSLARPWDYYSAVMTMNSTLGAHISKTAYTSGTTKNQRYVCWTNSGQVAAQPTSPNVHFYEYNNNGTGSLTAAVNGMTLVSASDASNYNNKTTIYGSANGYSDSWTPTIIDDSQQITTSITITSASGYAEGAYVEFETDADSVLAYCKKSTDSSYGDAVDSQLVRLVGGIGRVDVVGLKAGTYLVKLVDSSNSAVVAETSILTVTADDRSGYAHFNRTEGVGAYNNDGTLKDNAVIVYVTENNKNTVTANGYTGIANIIINQSKSSNPLVIRIIGTIGAAMWASPKYSTSSYSEATATTIRGNNDNYLQLQNYEESDLLNTFNVLDESVYSKLNNLTNKIKYDSSKKEFDSYYNMLDVSNANNVTIEGIGIDATIAQWGITWKSCNSIEIKNLTFKDYPEDACAFEGSYDDLSTSTTSLDVDTITSGYYWIHNNTFNIGKNNWDVCKEHDKGDGDGSTDIKKVRNATYSYNKYVGTHKTGLVGGSEKHVTANITFHHNWYVGCKSRMPYARQANMHMYNNYYDSSTGTTMQIYAGAYAFVENCYFKNDKKTFEFNNKGYTTPAIKSYNNIFDGSSTYDISGVTITTDRTQAVSNGNIFNQNFDTDSSYFYYDSGNHVSNVSRMDSASELPTIIPNLAGAGLNGGTYTDTVIPEQTKYILTYDENGHGTAPSPVEVATITNSDLPSLTADGYVFVGWYNEAACTTQVTAGTTLTGPKTIYAKWVESSGNQTTLDLSSYSSSATTISDTVVIGDFTVYATSEKNVAIYNSRIELKGGGSTTYRCISFTATAGQIVTVTYYSSSGRHLVLKGQDNSSQNSSDTTGGGADQYVFTITTTQTYYLYSASNGINISSVSIQ